MGPYDLTNGTLLLGVFFNAYLYGLVAYQFVLYYNAEFNDRPAIKCMVLFLFVLDTFHSVIVVYMVWNYTVTNYTNPAALAEGDWPYDITPVFTALTALVTQMFQGHRRVIWCLTSSKLLYGVVVVLSITSFVLGFACTIEAWIIWVVSELPRITPLVICWLTLQVVVDAFISITLVIVFFRSRTGIPRTDSVLNRLIRGSVQIGLFAGLFAIGDLVSFVVIPDTNLYGMFAIPLGRIYTNTLLDSLLTRKSLTAELQATYDVSKELGSIQWGPAESSQVASNLPPTGDALEANGIASQSRVDSTAHDNVTSPV